MTTQPTATADAPTLDVDSTPTPTTSTAVAVPTAGGDVVSFADNEWSDVGDGDLAPGEQLLPLLPMNRKIGEGVLNPTTGELTDNLEFIWLARSISRAWFEKSFDEAPSDPPGCTSADGLVGRGAFGPGSDHNPTGKCATCPMNTWDPPAGVRPCRASIEAMVALPDTADGGVSLYRLRFGGISYAPARAFWDSFKARLPRIPAIGFISRMTLEPTQTKNGKFLLPEFKRVQQLERQALQPLIDERDRLIDEFQRVVSDEVATSGADVDEQDHRTSGAGPFDDEASPSTGMRRTAPAAGGDPGPTPPEYGVDEEPF